MAGLRSGRPACIRAAFASTRAGFQKRWRNTPRRFKVLSCSPPPPLLVDMGAGRGGRETPCAPDQEPLLWARTLCGNGILSGSW